PAFEAVEISDLSLNDNPTRAIRTLHRSDPRRPGVLLRRYDTTPAPRATTGSNGPGSRVSGFLKGS
ncbi:hypothetical protein, partial [Propionibacterium freudenreichii]|uniref:hypothetical protein n=1 Tax=Propionibacterium freudenreichii TaxID=1744 RepID=UPI00254B87E0